MPLDAAKKHERSHKQSANDLDPRTSCGVRATTATTTRKKVVAAVVADEKRTVGHLFRAPCLQHAWQSAGKSVGNILQRPSNLRPATSVIVMQQLHERVSLESCLQSTLLYVRTTPSFTDLGRRHRPNVRQTRGTTPTSRRIALEPCKTIWRSETCGTAGVIYKLCDRRKKIVINVRTVHLVAFDTSPWCAGLHALASDIFLLLLC